MQYAMGLKLNFKRRVTIGTLSGNTMVGIREYYEDKKTGDMLPGKKVFFPSSLSYPP